MKLKIFGDNTVILNFQDKSKEKNFIIWKFEIAKSIVEQFPNICEDFILTAYEITIIFKTKIDLDLINHLNKFIRVYEKNKKKIIRSSWKIPVCFDPIYSEDILIHFKNNFNLYNIFLKKFIRCTFQVNHYGFLPGFFYLSGLPKNLHLPRKSSPSKSVEKGTLAIGESNVGVYPQTSPGGWNKIGKTYVPFFDKKNNPPNVLVPGDKINFFSISIDELESKLIDFSDSMNKFKLNSFEIIY
ncbi:MAG: hypothetical protein CMC81_03790 [Flavobacteriaceae bacterium]|nr:hypothetical protein [Flavobacteriaceae bacterium]|tara:strand:+ start:6620 stop:7345 length:726 start_codon:yes stop_codon:yes gene_type:complete